MRLATNGVLAFRARGFKSWGEFPGYLYFGGNSELRGYDYLEFLGNKAFFAERRAALPAHRSGAHAARRHRRPARRVRSPTSAASGYEGIDDDRSATSKTDQS